MSKIARCSYAYYDALFNKPDTEKIETNYYNTRADVTHMLRRDEKSNVRVVRHMYVNVALPKGITAYPRYYGVHYHDSTVVEYYKDGSVQIDDCGFLTKTTAGVVNEYTSFEMKKIDGLWHIMRKNMRSYSNQMRDQCTWLLDENAVRRYQYKYLGHSPDNLRCGVLPAVFYSSRLKIPNEFNSWDSLLSVFRIREIDIQWQKHKKEHRRTKSAEDHKVKQIRGLLDSTNYQTLAAAGYVSMDHYNQELEYWQLEADYCKDAADRVNHVTNFGAVLLKNEYTQLIARVKDEWKNKEVKFNRAVNLARKIKTQYEQNGKLSHALIAELSLTKRDYPGLFALVQSARSELVLKARYDKTTKKLSDKTNTLQNTISTLQNKINTLQQRLDDCDPVKITAEHKALCKKLVEYQQRLADFNLLIQLPDDGERTRVIQLGGSS